MCRHDETLSPGDEDPRRLVPLNAAEQGVDGVSQAGEVRQALGRVEREKLGVLERQRDGKRRRGTQLQRKGEQILYHLLITISWGKLQRTDFIICFNVK